MREFFGREPDHQLFTRLDRQVELRAGQGDLALQIVRHGEQVMQPALGRRDAQSLEKRRFGQRVEAQVVVIVAEVDVRIDLQRLGGDRELIRAIASADLPCVSAM